MKIERFICGNLEANGYVVISEEGGEAWIIDPGYSHEKYVRYVEENGLSVKGVLLTHSHHDHMGKAGALRKALDCPVYMHREEAQYYGKDCDVALEGGEFLRLGDDGLAAIHTPGHTIGGLCFYSEKSRLSFTGDTIFNVDLGRTDFDGGSEDDMRRSLVDIIDKWGNDVTIHPGHGDPCTMKYVRRVNREFLDMVGGK